MKIRLLLFALLFPVFANSQMNDDFSDGDFILDPIWSGDDSNFEVNSDLQLQLVDDEASFSYLSTSLEDSSLDNKEWQFFIKQSFSGSDNNYSRVYLSSENADLTFSGNSAAGATGYFLRFGESGSDDAIRLYRDDLSGSAPVLLGSAVDGTISSSFEITIRVLRDDLGNWEVYADYSAGENYQLQFVANDAMYTTGAYLGVTAKYTISNADAFYFDDFYFGDEIVDEEIPLATGVQLISANELDVVFNEALDVSSAEQISNYNITGTGNPLDATLDLSDFKTVHLTFSDDFPEDVEQEITITNVEDLSSNVMESTSFNFTWSVPDIPTFRDVVINEILADPTPVVDLPEVEFVELYNASASTFNLEDWVFVNSVTEMVLPNMLMGPGEYVLLCDQGDAAQLSEYGIVVGISSFPALANLEDSLTLKDNFGNLLDIVDYNITWYDIEGTDDGGVTLEQKNPLSPCDSGSSNWGSSTNVDGGTPGGENSIFSDVLDTNPPVILNVSLDDDNVLLVSFDSPLDFSSVNVSNFSLSGGLEIEEIEDNLMSNELLLTTDVPINFEETYTLTITTLSDCEGNEITSDLVFDFVIGFEPPMGSLIINEIMPDPDEDYPSPNVEYVELYNTSDQALELKGTLLSDGEIETSQVIGPYGFVILTSAENVGEFSSDLSVIGILDFPSLTNSGTELELKNLSGEVLDFVEYDLSWYQDTSKDDGGYSLELINPNDPCSDKSNWSASQAISGATEGEENSVFDPTPDESAPSLLKILVWGSDSIEIVFDEPLNFESLDITDFIVSSSSMESLAVLSAESSGSNSIICVLDQDIPISIVWSIQIIGLEDCWGNPTTIKTQGLFAAIEEAQAGDLIINEVLFNPATNGVDYVEIYNRSPRNLSIKEWFLANEDDEIVEDYELITDEPYLILSGGYLVLCTDAYGVTSIYPFAVQESVLEIDDIPTYSNDEGVVILLNPNGELEDRFAYSDDMHFALLDEEDGVSLERIRSDEPTDKIDNWHSAAESQNFGTPGYLNSVSAPQAIANGEISIDPEVFSPDQDGYQDLTTIIYKFEEEGYVANVLIYDRAGREVRHLVKNELLGVDGTINWDGTSEEGSKLPIGIYVIVFEYFDLEGNVYKTKLPVVIAQFLN